MAGSHPAHPLQGNASLPACRVKARGSRSEKLSSMSCLPLSGFACTQPAAPTIFNSTFKPKSLPQMPTLLPDKKKLHWVYIT